ncbi:hypothetical protein EIP91_003095 [Steccherinum ochraceum]|uniref:Uncharacterized protein n=1 Tax=Steccherinum ochraceum TaxID=92696 RepID=A0A4R0RDF0_9APHY|nr:hypothetical protein EIP91_003095 [Steccherinum ochraceum]
MAYEYYQGERHMRGYGHKLGTPPIPNIMPQPHWRGSDYYMAHAINPDPHFFHDLLNLVYSTRGAEGYDQGVAKRWHRTVYGGETAVTRTLPRDLGAAAAYEAYRVWKHHRARMYPFSDNDRDGEREAVIGLAAAEASHLWRYTGRGMDNYGLREVMESAGLTAFNLASRVIGGGLFGGVFSGSSSSRRSSVSSGMYSDDYPRSTYQRHRRHSSLGTHPTMVMSRAGSSSPYMNHVALAGSVGTPYSHSVSLGGSQVAMSSHGSAYGGVASSHRSYGGSVAFPGSYSGSGYGTPSSYGGGATVIPVGAGYGGSSYGHSHGHGQPMTIQSSAFPGGAVTLPPVAPGSTIVIHGGKRSRHGSVSSSKRYISHGRSHSSGKTVTFI